MTEKAIPMLAKNVITQLVHPYVKTPNRTDRNPRFEPLVSFPFSSTLAVDKERSSAVEPAINRFMPMFTITKMDPYSSCIC